MINIKYWKIDNETWYVKLPYKLPEKNCIMVYIEKDNNYFQYEISTQELKNLIKEEKQKYADNAI